MARVRLLAGFALLAGFGLHCSSSSEGAPSPDAGDIDSGADGAVETGPSDVVPPTFDGITTAMALEETKVAVTWSPASDDVSPAGRIAYRVYASAPNGDSVDFSGPIATSVTGASSVRVVGLVAGAKYLFAVRAVDEAGNEDANVKTASAATMDSTPPKFGGVLDVKGADATKLQVGWNPATDNGSKASEIKYRVYVSSVAGMHDYTKPTFETLPGLTLAYVDGLLEAKPYFVVVRAVDAAGNMDGNESELSASTLDKTAPTFPGLTSATALGTSITLTWPVATDNVDASVSIVYDIFRSKSAVTDFTTPFASVTGSTDYTFSGLEVSTAYHFVVRAHDSSGNRDTNTVEKTATTAASSDIKPPTFGGLVSATAVNATSIDLKWADATDDFTPAALLLYDVFAADAAGGELFASSPLATVTGTTSYTVKGLKPSKPYFFVVRARDTAGNRDGNTIEKSASTPADTTRPTFGGLTSVSSLGPTQLKLQWSAASDDVSAASAITYRIFQASSAGGEVYAAPTATTTAGATSYVISGLLPNTKYFFVVRAVDEAGLADTNTGEKSGTTDKDSTAPTFGGVVSLTALGPTSVVATWSAASDDVASASEIVYDIFVSGTAGGEDLSSAKYTTAPGATNFTISGLLPKQSVFLIVRARDPYGNRDGNKVEKGTTTPADVTAPTFAGASSVSGATATTLTVNWTAATDDVTAAGNIKYLVCRSLTPTGCDGAGFTAFATVTGLTSYQFTGLTPLKDYYFRVRAQDEVPNIENNAVVISGKTVTDTTKPVFGGCTSAVPAPGAAGAAALTVSWTAATDDVSSPSQIVYDVWRSTSGVFNFATAPTYTSTPGATSVSATGLVPSTKYYFVCRARDAANNEDTNTNQVNGTTTADTTPPTFGGATSASALSDTSLQVFWLAASDNVTVASSIDYLVCWSTSSTACTSSFTALATVTGTTSYTAGGLTPSTTYYFVVRARDDAFKVDTNTVVRSATTQADITVPIFSGSPSAAGVFATGASTSRSLSLSWSAASDASPVHYEICATTSFALSYAACQVKPGAATYSTGSGATSYTLTGLTSATAYYVSIRAVDAAGNTETGSHYDTATTATSYFYDIAAKIFNAAPASGGCVGGCHTWVTPSGNWSRTATVGVASCGNSYVVPYAATSSTIYRKMAGLSTCVGGSQMPPAPGTPSSANITLMQNWINQGAFDN